MTETVKVRLRKPARVFTFLCKNIELKRSDSCIVRTDRGLEFGTCVMPPEELAESARERFKMSVVRRATDHDKMTQSQIKDEELRAQKTCAEKIRARNLPMKLVECEYSFDRRKVIFYFTAEDRVDFRQLVRDLARDLKTRIELRHIQVRDEAKIIGGIGTCGRELCCTTWMKDFIPISMRMAKKQNLSLNPSKISGQCGRLMCCLSYENELYSDQKKRQAPRTPDPRALESIRDKMEGDAPRAAEVLQKTSLSDLKVEEQAPAEVREPGKLSRPSREGDSESESERKQDVAGAKSSGGQETAPANDTSREPRRRRRRGRRGRGRGGKGGSASGGNKPNASG